MSLDIFQNFLFGVIPILLLYLIYYYLRLFAFWLIKYYLGLKHLFDV